VSEFASYINFSSVLKDNKVMHLMINKLLLLLLILVMRNT